MVDEEGRKVVDGEGGDRRDGHQSRWYTGADDEKA